LGGEIHKETHIDDMMPLIIFLGNHLKPNNIWFIGSPGNSLLLSQSLV